MYLSIYIYCIWQDRTEKSPELEYSFRAPESPHDHQESKRASLHIFPYGAGEADIWAGELYGQSLELQLWMWAAGQSAGDLSLVCEAPGSDLSHSLPLSHDHCRDDGIRASCRGGHIPLCINSQRGTLELGGLLERRPYNYIENFILWCRYNEYPKKNIHHSRLMKTSMTKRSPSSRKRSLSPQRIALALRLLRSDSQVS